MFVAFLVASALSVIPAVRSERITSATLPPEGYRIRIDPAGVSKIEANDDAGRFYAKQTLAQLPKSLRSCEIEGFTLMNPAIFSARRRLSASLTEWRSSSLMCSIGI